MRRYTLFHPVWMAFYAGDIYRDVARNWRGTGFLYLFVLLSICWIPEMPRIHDEIVAWITRETPKIVDQIPEIRIAGGRVSVDAPGPVFIRDPETGEVAAIVDVTGRYTSLEGTKATALLTETRLFVRNSPTSETQSFEIPQGENITINRQSLYRWLDALEGNLSVMLYPPFVAFSFLYRVLQVLLYAAVGTFFLQYFNASLPYLILIRLAVIAVTPVIVLDTVHNLLGATMPFWGGICFLIAMSYLYFGVKVNLLGDEPQKDERPGSAMDA